MIANLTKYFWGPEFVQKYLNMILHHILKPGQIGSGQKKDISDLAKMLFETYVPAASTLRYVEGPPRSALSKAPTLVVIRRIDQKILQIFDFIGKKKNTLRYLFESDFSS